MSIHNKTSNNLYLTIAVLVSALLITAPVTAKSYGMIAVERVISIYDADTFRVDIAGYPPIIGERMPIRVSGIDAPELRGKCQQEKGRAREAKQFTVAALRSAQTIELHNMQRGKYFRILADVYVDGSSLADLLISTGHARIYDGGKRGGWCGN